VRATLFCVIAVLASRRYDAAPRGAVRAKLFAVAISALMCKETAAVLPLLIVGDAWIRRRLSRALAIDVGYLLAFFGGVAMLRLMSASSLVRQPVTRYVAQRWLFGTLGSLVVPWHVDVVRSWPWVPIVGSICVLILATAFFMRQGSNLRTNEALGWLLWTCLGTAPTIAFFFVGQDLQNSRYLYLSSVGYGMLLTTMAFDSETRAGGALGWALVSTLIALNAFGVRFHQAAWRHAGEERSAIELAARNDDRLRACRSVAITNLPDTVNGAYLFRNGGDLEFRDLGLVLIRDAAPGCTFQWDRPRHRFVRTDTKP